MAVTHAPDAKGREERHSVTPAWPTMYDLPSEDPEEPGLPDDFHYYQPQLLRESFRSPLQAEDRVYIGSDINLYYDRAHPLWHKRPDWFLVLHAPKLYRQNDLRWSYVVWDEPAAPYLVVELLSPGTEKEDLGENPQRRGEELPCKWEVYQDILKIPYYVVFDRYVHRFRAYRLIDDRYQPLNLESNRLWLPEAGAGLALWTGSYEKIEGIWLRWYDAEERWLPTKSELLDQERQRAQRLADRLKALGIDPEE